MTRRVGGFVEVDDTGADVGLEVTLEGRSTGRDWGEVAGANKHCAGMRLAMTTKIPGGEAKNLHFS